MPNPLDREWLPDAERMRSTTTWILRREPILVRVAPVVIVFVVAALGIWIAQARVSVYESLPGEMTRFRAASPSDTLEVRFDAKQADIAVGSLVVVAPGTAAAARERVDASVVGLHREEHEGRTATVLTLLVPKDALFLRSGPATVRVRTGERTLLSEFVATARAGGKSQ